jgi:GT2 family glycosyltransferase
MSIALCTAGRRPELLRRSLASLIAQDDPSFEVLVVENAAVPTLDPATLPSGVRYVHEPRIGLDVARNRAIAEAAGDLIAFTDDDCEADPAWASAVRDAFSDGADCVTGRVVAASTSLPTERWFEARFSFDRGTAARTFRAVDVGAGVPFCPWEVGTGCNMAFRRGVVESVGGFDERLDMGTPIGGAGDLDLFARLLVAGRSVRYEPDALVWHHHRTTAGALRRQFLGYGATFSALGMLAVRRWPQWRRAVLRGVGARARECVRRIVRSEMRRGSGPVSLALCEFAGLVWGPIGLFVSTVSRRGTS